MKSWMIRYPDGKIGVAIITKTLFVNWFSRKKRADLIATKLHSTNGFLRDFSIAYNATRVRFTIDKKVVLPFISPQRISLAIGSRTLFSSGS